MKKTLLILTIAIFTVAFAFSATSTTTPSVSANITGSIEFEELTIKLIDQDSNQEISLIDFSDLTELNTIGWVISPKTIKVVYNYNKPSSIEDAIVQMSVSSQGLTTDGGNTYPIKVVLVDPKDTTKEVTWDSIEVKAGEAESYVFYQSFNVKLIKTINNEIPIGSYSGNVSLSLVSV